MKEGALSWARARYWRHEVRRADALRKQPLAGIRSAGSAGEVRALADRAELLGFNGQALRIAWLAWLFRATGCTSFVETGTRWGYTAVTARRLLGCPVTTVELRRNTYQHAKIVAAIAQRSIRPQGITFQQGDSRDALARWLDDMPAHDVPMIYLDAHAFAFKDHPLRLEVELCVKRGRCVVVIDDFRVPGDEGFQFDSFHGFTIEFGAIWDLLPRDRVRAFAPGHASEDETGYRTGAGVLLIDAPIAGPDAFGTFPGSLLREVDLTTYANGNHEGDR